ncbi:ABC transporter permease [Priestia megaterium]|uniref:Binding--dependent transport system inner membrane component family protein n=1 Tax=Priestia megaterium (strain ATCC 14581 / DSM 32 / CCUG 1817 / JCM 2506 / NBRC 15308 / NCIMB 9376 / NCTC 10342 / NRRL B-14308 / VKM B-512 / Ford 19) TaxID=1348623 RepID=A0A0B6AHL6_PRIM2|nr:oligopeptide ABC transporter permease [Priestia megaterium]AJI23001.1 binding--dependent transport system inner membrane component family protein [Priestia megaterium NBRC 15308 = ATCC 14581]KFM96257.1 binding--dependent transport system inner membrane component family protein [Priestia megaterium]KGJ76380.1 peptide ABC transporter permease [Priestia megaterium NBRC 15308 = ATCC 14581]MBU8751918.1 ABC transporter permease [Priestia megaterium]MDQ0803030.1 peptide/nickel transport system per
MEIVTKKDVQPEVNMKAPKNLSPWAIARKKFVKNKLAMISLAFMIVITLLAIFAPLLTKADITRIDYMAMNAAPSSGHWFGTDTNGRDVFARTLYGGRTSLLIGVACTTLVILIGTLIGSIAGYYGGKVDQFLMRFTDFVLNFPLIVFVVVLNTILIGKISGVWTLILVVSFLSWGSTARLVRSKVLAEKENEYVLSAVSIGCSPFKIIFKHLLPNVFSTIVVQASLQMAILIVFESAISFIGFGVPADTPSWGNMLTEARESDVLQNKPWMWVPPGLAITFTILAINFIGEGLKDALNPKSLR